MLKRFLVRCSMKKMRDLGKFAIAISVCLAVGSCAWFLALWVVNTVVEESTVLSASDFSPVKPVSQILSMQRGIVNVGKKSDAAVVAVHAERIARVDDGENWMGSRLFAPWLQGRDVESKSKKVVKKSTGFVVHPSGYVLTSYSNVRSSEKLSVIVHNGQGGKMQYSAVLEGGDELSDIALIKISSKTRKHFPALSFEWKTPVKVGDLIVVIGNPFGMKTFSFGVVSAIAQDNFSKVLGGYAQFKHLIQMNMNVNPGTAGGPVLNVWGKVVGMVAEMPQTPDLSMGFALSTKRIWPVLCKIIEQGFVRRGYLGVFLLDTDKETRKLFGLKQNGGGVVVQRLQEDSAAHKAGILPGDVIAMVNKIPVKNKDHVIEIIATKNPGDVVSAKILRHKNGRIIRKEARILLGTRPDSSKDAQKIMHENHEKSFSEWRGLKLGNVSSGSGVIVLDVGNVAQKMQLRKGDVIEEVNYQRVNNLNDFIQLTGKIEAKGTEQIFLLVRRTVGSKIKKFMLLL